jgi:hypothetical protein
MGKEGMLGSKICFDIAETLSISQLSEGHAEILVETIESSYVVVSMISGNTASKCVQGHEVHDL